MANRLASSSGGYLAAKPTQNTGSFSGSIANDYFIRAKRKSSWPAGKTTSISSSFNGLTRYPSGMDTNATFTLSESGCVGGGGTAVWGAEDTTVGLLTDANGNTFVQVQNAAPGSTGGGTATNELRTIYYYSSGGSLDNVYSGSNWGYVYVQGDLQKHGNVTANCTIEASTGRLLVSGHPVYFYDNEASDKSNSGVGSTWPSIAANGGNHTNAITGNVTQVMASGSTDTGYTWNFTAGATSGSNWAISGTTLTLTLTASNVETASYGSNRWAAIRFDGGNSLKTADGFFLPEFTIGVQLGTYGGTAGGAAGSAKTLKQSGQNTSGVYWIKAVDGSNSRQLYCDQTTNGGGWTRFANWDAGNQSSPYSWQHSVDNYNLGSLNGTNTDSLHYCAYTHAINRRQYSTGTYLEYMFEIKNGNYKFKIDSWYTGDPGTGSRGTNWSTGYSNSHFDWGWLNNNNNGFWGSNTGNTTNSNCVSSQHIVHSVSGYNTWGGNGYFSLNRGYKSTGGTSAGCGDHCGNIRRYWQVVPGIWHTQHCYAGYYNVSGFDGGNRHSAYYRERGTVPSGGY